MTKELRQKHREEIVQPRPTVIESFFTALPSVAKAAAQVLTAYYQQTKNPNNNEDQGFHSNMITFGEPCIGYSSEEEEEERSNFASSSSNLSRFSDGRFGHLSINSKSDSDSD